MSSKAAQEESPEPERELEHALDHAAHLLPAQGPIGVFIHHNTLHAFQHLPFHEAIAAASAEFETHPYLRESEYRACFDRGRIDEEDLELAIEEHLDGRTQALAIPLPEIWRIALRYPLPIESQASLRWKIDEVNALEIFRDEVDWPSRQRMISTGARWLMRQDENHLDRLVGERPAGSIKEAPEAWVLRALWTACEGVASQRSTQSLSEIAARVPKERSHRDLLRAVTGTDPAMLVNPLMIRFCAAYLDQGTASWPMPDRKIGFFLWSG